MRGTREGWVLLCKQVRWSHWWKLPTPLEVFSVFMKERGYAIELSAPGRLVTQMVANLGGLWGVTSIAHEEIVRLLNSMAHGVIEDPDGSAESDRTARCRRKVRPQVASRDEWFGLLKKINNNEAWLAERRLASLVNNGVLRVGLYLSCPQCSQRTWYGLSDILPSLTCERCLQKFEFPAATPPDKWWYRSVGSYAVENYSQGGVCVALALRFLSEPMEGATTWIPSFNLKKDDKSLEADFGVFWRPSFLDESNPTLVFGECKSYDRFEEKDFRRMRKLGEAFPGAVLAFCMFRKSFSAFEKRRLKALASSGRSHLQAGRWRNPVLIMTGEDLFSYFNAQWSWKTRMQGREYPLQSLCEESQQRYLGMESYSRWLERKAERRRRGQT